MYINLQYSNACCGLQHLACCGPVLPSPSPIVQMLCCMQPALQCVFLAALHLLLHCAAYNAWAYTQSYIRTHRVCTHVCIHNYVQYIQQYIMHTCMYDIVRYIIENLKLYWLPMVDCTCIHDMPFISLSSQQSNLYFHYIHMQFMHASIVHKQI